LTEATDGRLTDHLATVLAARYAVALAGWDGEVTEEFRRKLRVLRGLCRDIVELRRGDHSGARLNLEQERLEREQEKTEEEVVEHFKCWVKNPQVRDWICQNWVSPEERERRLREIFGRAPKTPDEAATDGPESNPVKPDQTESNQIQIKSNQFNQLNQRWAARPFLDSCQFDQSRLNRASVYGRVLPHRQGQPML
jgi:hypothetical protein